MLLGTLLGCQGLPSLDDVVPDDDEQGIVVSLRTLEGGLVEPSEVQLGGASFAVPDSAGFVYFFGVPPGRTPVAAVAAPEDEGPSYGHAVVSPTELVASRLVPLPLVWTEGSDAAEGASVTGDGVTVDVGADVLALDGVGAVGPFRIGWGIPGPGQMRTIPGDHLGLHGDVDIHPIELDSVFVVQAEDASGAPFRVLTEKSFAVTVPVPPGSIVERDGVETVSVYAWIHSRGYWMLVAVADVDGEDEHRTATFQAGSFGWFALGHDAGELGCVTGRLTDGVGKALAGLEVRLEADGAVAPDRATTVNGSFCVVGSPDTTATLDALGYAADRSRMFTWSGEATIGAAGACGTSACTDLGTVSVETWSDADGDHTFSGPGGDCDDHDGAINPSPVFGDSTYCGGVL